MMQSEKAGLRPMDYQSSLLNRKLDRLLRSDEITLERLARFDTALSARVVRYLSDLHQGRVDPRAAGYSISTHPSPLEFADLLVRLSDAEDVENSIENIQPRLRIYHRLKQALANYKRLARDKRFATDLPSSVTIHPGEIYQGLVPLKRLLIAIGDLKTEAADLEQSGNHYDGSIVVAVKAFQRRHGLDTDGIIGKKTLTQLNVSMTRRVEQIEFALERIRWLPELDDGRYIVVNIPAFELYAFHLHRLEETLERKMNVIVGSAINKTKTPVFSGTLRYVVFRPYWNVPYSITMKELLPKIAQDPAYLKKKNYEIIDSGRRVSQTVSPKNRAGLRAGRLTLRQRPGQKNALGLVKFIFPNDNSVYLHSTPSTELFSKTRRDFSHGCIRVEDPVALAEFVLSSQDVVWTRETIQRTMAGTRNNRKVNLNAPMPVYIFYTTALVRENNEVYFFDDIYGHDARLRKLLLKRRFSH